MLILFPLFSVRGGIVRGNPLTKLEQETSRQRDDTTMTTPGAKKENKKGKVAVAMMRNDFGFNHLQLSLMLACSLFHLDIRVLLKKKTNIKLLLIV